MMTAFGSKWLLSPSPSHESTNALSFSSPKLGLLDSSDSNTAQFERKREALRVSVSVYTAKPRLFSSIKAMEKSTTVCVDDREGSGVGSLKDLKSEPTNGSLGVSDGNNRLVMSSIGKSTNILWHECSIGKLDRQKLLQQKGCVIWITGLSGSGKSTVACALSRALYQRGKLSYVLDGDNVRHGLNRDLSFKAEDRAENIRRVGEVAKLFADAGVICIASLISPYRRDRDACRALLPDKNFIEVFMDVPLHVCEARDPKGLYKLARAGKIKGFTGIDDPYEPPVDCEISIRARDGNCSSPVEMADQVVSYLEEKGFLQA